MAGKRGCPGGSPDLRAASVAWSRIGGVCGHLGGIRPAAVGRAGDSGRGHGWGPACVRSAASGRFQERSRPGARRAGTGGVWRGGRHGDRRGHPQRRPGAGRPEPASEFGAWCFTVGSGPDSASLVVTPFLLALRSMSLRRSYDVWRLVEGLGLIVCTLGVTWWVVTGSDGEVELFLVFPLLIWAAWRFQLKGAAPCVVAVSVVTVYATVRDLGPLDGINPQAALITAQTFVAVTALATLFLSVAVTERNDAREETDLSHHELARAVNTLGGRLLPRSPSVPSGFKQRRSTSIRALAYAPTPQTMTPARSAPNVSSTHGMTEWASGKGSLRPPAEWTPRRSWTGCSWTSQRRRTVVTRLVPQEMSKGVPPDGDTPSDLRRGGGI